MINSGRQRVFLVMLFALCLSRFMGSEAVVMHPYVAKAPGHPPACQRSDSFGQHFQMQACRTALVFSAVCCAPVRPDGCTVGAARSYRLGVQVIAVLRMCDWQGSKIACLRGRRLRAFLLAALCAPA